MDRLSQLRGEAGSSRDSTLDTSSPPSEAFMTANESSSKYFSLSEVDSTFDISPIKDVSLTSANMESEKTVPESDQLISNLSPIGKKDFMDGYKIGKQIEAANILSGGVDIFDDNDNSYDGDELVIDDNAEIDEKSNPDLKLAESSEATLVEADAVPSKDIEVILQIDGKNVDAIDIGNGLYLYRKQGQEELAAVQIIDDDQHQPSFKFLKVRENAEGNLEVYEEIQIEVPNEVPVKEEKVVNKSVSRVPIKEINKVISDSTSNKITERKTQNIIPPAVTVAVEPETETNKEVQIESKTETSKKIKFSESRKSPVIGSFTPMTFHSTPNKEGIPLTKTMVDQQLHPSRHSDNIKKTIEVHTDSAKQRTLDPSGKTKDTINDDKMKSVLSENDISAQKNIVLELGLDNKDLTKNVVVADVMKDNKSVEVKTLITDQIGDELVIVKKPLDSAENLKIKSPDMFKTGDKISLESPATEENMNKSETKEENKLEIVKEIAVPAAKNKLIEDIGLSKTTSVQEITENKKNEPAVENEKAIDKIVDVDHNELKINSTKISMRATKVPKIDSNDNDSSKIVANNEIVVEDQFLIDANDEVCSKVCTDNIKNHVEHKIKNTTDEMSIQDKIVQNENEELLVTTDKGNKKLNHQIEEKNENLILSTEEDEHVLKISKAQPIEQKVNTSNNTAEQKVTSANKLVIEGIDEKLTLLQKQHDTQVDKERKPGTTLSDSKSDLPTSAISCKSSKIEPKLQSTNANNTLSDLKSDSPISAIPCETSKIKSNVQSNNVNEGNEIQMQDIKHVPAQNIPDSKKYSVDKKPSPQITLTMDSRPINNNHAAVPFGKWTEVNRQAFLNRIKESKVPTNSSNGKQIKNSNDLNRRDVLKKIDSQRSSIASAKAQELKIESQRQPGNNTAKTQDFGSATRMGVKKEAALANKQPASEVSRLALKTETSISKNSSVPVKKAKQETIVKPQIETVASSVIDIKKESKQRKEINNQDLIDKTIEDLINRPISAKTPQEEQAQRCYDEIEMKMNELHGKPFIERPIHELPPAQKLVTKTNPKSENLKATISKPSKIPNLVPFNKSPQKTVKENITEIDSEEEVIIEHEPITGDMDLDNNKAMKIIAAEKLPVTETVAHTTVDSNKQETIITERDFDKFARRNSISYENCITVNFDGKEPHNVIQSVVQKDVGLKTYSKIESRQHDAKVILPRKRELFIPNSHLKNMPNTKYGNTIIEDDGKNYQSKVKMAYQTAMTAKRQMEQPITIIEDRPVKVVYMDTNTEFISNQLNVRGKELSPAKKTLSSLMSVTTLTTDSQDSDNTLDSIEEEKLIDDSKIKTKHQRKQVLTPVETPELELIEPNDLGIDVSPKKKRKTEEKVEKNMKVLVPKKSYLLGRGNTLENLSSKSIEYSKTSQRDTMSQDISHKNTASAIDSLVKAAELLETQSGNMPTKAPETPTSDSQQNTPVKRGRGRPRKYPISEGTPDKKSPSPQKKPRLIDAKVVKSKDSEDDSSTDDDVMVKENWTMGKINENIVCPICKKLFRSENVVFKHVKHCTGPSPSRSDSENKIPRRLRESQESESRSYESKSEDNNMEIEESETSLQDFRIKRKSKESQLKTAEKDDVIIIEDTPIKAKPNKNKRDKAKLRKDINESKVPDKVSSLVCEFCGKSFRQLSYLVSHKLQHSKDDESKPARTKPTILSCEVCEKQFRKLHHLVQHRLIHNQSNASAKMSRKSSSEQNHSKASKAPKPTEPKKSTGFRCEPCDKSFRKLHHLVEHRETHDGINRQRNMPAVQASAEKLLPPPQCEHCKKTFRKLHHLIEHKEHHLEISSEKSDDKSVKSSLSTKDIIHECSLCYMVFPNEHSLNKHTIICQRKKRQSATKQIKQTEENETGEEETETIKFDENKAEKGDDDVTIVADEVVTEEISTQEVSKEVTVADKTENKMEIVEEPVKLSTKPVVLNESPKPNSEVDKKEDSKAIEPIKPNPPITEVIPDLSAKVKKLANKELKPKVNDTPRKKTPLKDKAGPTVTKRLKPIMPPPVIESKASKLGDSSDEDEARYMLNPDYKFDDNEGKLFMKVRANKRNSLQIERPNSKDLVKRRISLQHPLKVPRLKAKAILNKIAPHPTPFTKTVTKPVKPEPALSSDSDDSDVKYSFPKNAPGKVPKPNLPGTSTKDSGKKTQRKSLADKRKSLSSIAKRKSLGKAVGAKHKVKPSPVKQVRKRTTEVEHRCDCGQLFSSAALLSRHTTLAHTPPRIRRRRSPPPDVAAGPAVVPAGMPAVVPAIKPAPRKPSLPATKSRPSADSRKSSIKSDSGIPTKTTQPTKRKLSTKTEPKTPNETRKSPKTSENTDVKTGPTNKLRRYAAHRGVPVPEKMRKLMEKSKK